MPSTPEQEFASLCRSADILFVPAPVKHGDIVKATVPGAGGVCFALTCTYLSRYLMNVYIRGLINDVADPFAGQTYETLIKLIKENGSLRHVLMQLQQYEGSRSHVVPAINSMGLKGEASRRAAIGIASELDKKGIIRNAMFALGLPKSVHFDCEDFVDAIYPYNGCAGKLAETEGAYYISMPGHGVASICDPSNRYYTLMDCNFGEVRMTRRTAYEKFLEAYLRGPIAALYSRMSSGGAGATGSAYRLS